MSTAHRRSRRPEIAAAPIQPRALMRAAAAGTAGVLLLGAAFQASVAGAARGPVGIQASYPDDAGGLGTGAQIGIGLGGAAAAWGLLVGTGVLGGAAAGGTFAVGAPHGFGEQFAALPADHDRVTSLRLVPEQSKLEAGRCRYFRLEARSARDDRWYSVTMSPHSSIEAQEPAGALVRQDGSRNIFCLPLTAPASDNERTVTLVGTLRLPGQEPGTATARVRLVVPAASR